MAAITGNPSDGLIGAAPAPQAAASGFRSPYMVPDTTTAALGVLLAITVLATIAWPAKGSGLSLSGLGRAGDQLLRGGEERLDVTGPAISLEDDGDFAGEGIDDAPGDDVWPHVIPRR
jgi:hypothetical protein